VGPQHFTPNVTRAPPSAGKPAPARLVSLHEMELAGVGRGFRAGRGEREGLSASARRALGNADRGTLPRAVAPAAPNVDACSTSAEPCSGSGQRGCPAGRG
jgi:hypothetical protein